MFRYILYPVLFAAFFVYGFCGFLSVAYLDSMNNQGWACVDSINSQTLDKTQACRKWDETRGHSPWYEKVYSKAVKDTWAENRVKDATTKLAKDGGR